MAETSTRVAEQIAPADALAWAQEAPGGALGMMIMSATGSAVDVAPAPDAAARLDAAAQRALAAGAIRALAWQARGRVPEGAPMTVLVASAPTRREAKAALDALVAGLRGVAERRDVA